MNKSTTSLTGKISLAGLLITLTVVVSNLLSFMIPMFGVPSLIIDVGAIGLIVGSILLGPKWGILIGVSSDLIGYFIFRGGYPFYPGFTFNAMVIGGSVAILFALFKPLPQRTLSISTYAILSALVGFSLLLIVSLSSVESMTSTGVVVYDLSSWSIKLILIGLVLGSFIASLILLKLVQRLFTPDAQLFLVIVLIVSILEIVVAMGLTSIWISDMYGIPYLANFFIRIIRGFPLIPLKSILVYLILKLVPQATRLIRNNK